MSRMKILVSPIGLMILVLVLAGCAPSFSPQSPVATTAPVPAAFAPITVTDSANRTVTLSGVPERIVSLAPSTTEIAFALGLGSHIVAVDKWSDYPAETKNLTKLEMRPVNLESIVALKPDLVLAAGITNAEDVKKLAALNLNVLVVGTSKTSFEGVSADIILLGKATGTEGQAKTITDRMKQKVDAVKAKIATAQTKPRVYWEIDGTDVAKPYTAGPGSFVNDIIDLAGGVNAAAGAKAPWAQISAEEIVAANPDIIILSDSLFGVTSDSVKARRGWSVINAAKNDKIFPIDDNLVSRAGPRVADGLEAAARLIHPELFK